MNVLDELREAVIMTVVMSNQRATSKTIDEAFDAFEAAHPGLADSTIPCYRCGKPCTGEVTLAVYRNGASGPRYKHEPICPACAKEGK